MATIAARKHYLFGGSIVLLAAVGLYGLLPRLGSFAGSWDALNQANMSLAVIAVFVSLAASICSALVYTLLRFKPLKVSNTVIVQLSGLFINKILPAGIGGLGLNYLYLRKHKHTLAQASTVVAVNNLLGFVGHGMLIVIAVLGYLIVGRPLSVAVPELPPMALQVAGVLIVVGLIGLLWLRRRKSDLQRTEKSLMALMRHYGKRPQRLVLSLLISIVMTLCNVVSFWLCCLALNIDINLLPALLIFTVGIAVGTATPTPGGLGGIEAGLTAGLASQGVAVDLALAAALLYRFASYWFGLGLGAIMFIVVHKRRLLAEI